MFTRIQTRTGAILLLAFVCSLTAQTGPPSSTQGPSSARQLPLSDRTNQPGTVMAVPAPASGQDGSVFDPRLTISAQGAYAGSVPGADNTGTVLPLKLDY